MHPDDPACLAPGCASFTPETWRIGNKLFRKIGNAQNFLAKKVRQLNFRSRRKEKVVLLQPIHVSFKLRKLRCADHAIASHQKRRADLDITVLSRVQVDHEINQGAFQLRTRSRETDKTAAAKLRGAFQIEELQLRAESNVIRWVS